MKQTLLDAYEQLERLLKRRDQLGIYLLLYGGSLMVFAGLPTRAWRMGGGAAFYVSLALVTLIMGALGLALLVRFVVTFKELREVREEIDYYRYTDPEPKRKRTRFTIGDDGELVPVETFYADEDEASQRYL